MRTFILLGMTAVLASCSAAEERHEQQQSAPAAATTPAAQIPADKVEVRFLIAKASLPATLTAEPSAKDQAVTRTPVVGKDLAALSDALRGRVPIGSLGGPKCFKVCENNCFGIGENQTCVPQCHIECID